MPGWAVQLIASVLAESEMVQQEEEGGQPETGVWTPTGWRGEHRKEMGEGGEWSDRVPDTTQHNQI